MQELQAGFQHCFVSGGLTYHGCSTQMSHLHTQIKPGEFKAIRLILCLGRTSLSFAREKRFSDCWCLGFFLTRNVCISIPSLGRRDRSTSSQLTTGSVASTKAITGRPRLLCYLQVSCFQRCQFWQVKSSVALKQRSHKQEGT